MRYKTILNKKIEEETKATAKQEKLKEENGIVEPDVVVKKRTGKHLLKSIFFGALYIIRLILAAIGVLVLIDPALRETFIATILNFVR